MSGGQENGVVLRAAFPPLPKALLKSNNCLIHRPPPYLKASCDMHRKSFGGHLATIHPEISKVLPQKPVSELGVTPGAHGFPYAGRDSGHGLTKQVLVMYCTKPIIGFYRKLIALSLMNFVCPQLNWDMK